jgi:hypothetical protein
MGPIRIRPFAESFSIELRTNKEMHRGGGSLVRLPD